VRALLSQKASGGEDSLWTLPRGVSGGQTLLLGVRQPNELLDVTVPSHASEVSVVTAQSSYGHAVHVSVPRGAEAGLRLLVSVPIPPQGVNVTLPSWAQPGSQVCVPLPPLLGADDADRSPAAQGTLGAQGAAAGADSRRRSGPPRKRPLSANDASEAADSPGAKRRPQQALGAPASGDDRRSRRDAAHAALCALTAREEEAHFEELHALPETLDAYLLCAEAAAWLGLPATSFAEWRRLLLTPAAPAAPTLLSRLHAELLVRLVPAAAGAALAGATGGDGGDDDAHAQAAAWLRGGDGWVQGLCVALASGLWKAAHGGELPLPSWVAQGTAAKRLARQGKYTIVIDFGPLLCGTFGCSLPNNHAGLHAVPSDSGGRGSRARHTTPLRAVDAPEAGCESAGVGPAVAATAEAATAAEGGPLAATVAAAVLTAAAATAPADAGEAPAVVRAYQRTSCSARMRSLRCLLLATLEPVRKAKARDRLRECFLGAHCGAGYWALHEAPLVARAAAAGNGAPSDLLPPFGRPWRPVALSRGELEYFLKTLARCCGRGARAKDVEAARRLKSSLERVLGEADRALLRPPLTAPPPPPPPLPAMAAAATGGGARDAEFAAWEPPRVRVSVRAARVPIGHRLLEVRATLKLTVARMRKSLAPARV
jgi:hypothetical protein